MGNMQPYFPMRALPLAGVLRCQSLHTRLAVRKLRPSVLQSRSSDGEVGESPNLVDQTMAPCPRIDMMMMKCDRMYFPDLESREVLTPWRELAGTQPWTYTLVSGYDQVPVAEQDDPKMAFSATFGLFKWNCMPFGLCNAPRTFQRLMQRMFRDQQCQSLLFFLDDIIVLNSSVTQHLQQLEVVRGCLQRECLKAKPEKCAFPQGSCNIPFRYLSYTHSWC